MPRRKTAMPMPMPMPFPDEDEAVVSATTEAPDTVLVSAPVDDAPVESATVPSDSKRTMRRGRKAMPAPVEEGDLEPLVKVKEAPPYFQTVRTVGAVPRPKMPPNWEGTLVLNLYAQASAGEDAYILGSRNALTVLRDWLTWLLDRPSDATGFVMDGVEDSSGMPYHIRVRMGSDRSKAEDWVLAKPEYDPEKSYKDE